MEHVGIVVNDLAAAIEFFVELGLEPRGKGQVEDSWVERIIALDEVKVEFAMLRTPGGEGEIELVKFHSPATQTGDPHAPANTPGLRHLAFLVDDIHVRRQRPSRPRHRTGRRAGALRGQLLALLRPRPRGNHRRASREDRLMRSVRQAISRTLSRMQPTAHFLRI
jgi:catechol 2,3-dioxygenase-like lactoylglutathione lyase family enzyme